ncbi:NAD(P)H-dependent glycerol-3-phosphate dehydrogenase [Alkalimarinus sediminis]|uniref:Glycerol-3-phosphate dehydrogenase [NAD(P)+] n=1 Tax=Alkalimarinus sediminis TaxID=1632866 RepID=A0A9E8HK77_9ALTE|nr:NAD(P)H-dependent glycerol-3-phosphate dehydrogenase [Alkalimarinus sediminis]UZW76183.1 NAD(P)H-dependent glycerol-3-phosphate dehydrogenase [Alkalimarinus sediminis]
MSVTRTVTVLGGGSFGTAIANIAATNGHRAFLWMRDAKRAVEVQETRENKRYMPGYHLHENLTATTDIEHALNSSDIIFVSIPSKSFRTVVENARQYIKPHQIVVSTTKGIESGSFLLMSQILEELLPKNPIGVLSGPNLAKEIAQKTLTATVIASESSDVRNSIQDLLGCSYFRVYANLDTYGVELGGALKNIYAIMSGLAEAYGMGENTKSMLVTRSLAEMSRFAVCLGANPMTFLGLAGVGDLMVTCNSSLSRNYRVGYAVGKGKKLEDAIEELGEVAEGINTLRSVKAKADELEVYMPLVQGLYAILIEQHEIKDIISGMMLAQQSTDVEFILPRHEV